MVSSTFPHFARQSTENIGKMLLIVLLLMPWKHETYNKGLFCPKYLHKIYYKKIIMKCPRRLGKQQSKPLLSYREEDEEMFQQNMFKVLLEEKKFYYYQLTFVRSCVEQNPFLISTKQGNTRFRSSSWLKRTLNSWWGICRWRYEPYICVAGSLRPIIVCWTLFLDNQSWQ